MKVNEFIEKLKKIEKMPTLYKLGTFLNKKDDKYLLTDCSGLIKGILWGYPEEGKYEGNKIPDINANTMIKRCNEVSDDFTKMKKGSLVWMNGHIGVHIGNGICIESSPKWENGVQCTFIKNSGFRNTKKLHERKWTKHGLFKYIEYEEEKPLKKSIDEIAKEVIKGKWGNGSKRIKALQKAGYNYQEVQKRVNEILKG